MSSGPTAPDLEIVVFPVAVIKHGLAVPPLGNYGISVVRIHVNGTPCFHLT